MTSLYYPLSIILYTTMFNIHKIISNRLQALIFSLFMSLSVGLYADNFVITISGTGGLDEISWSLSNAANSVVASGGGYDFSSNNTISVNGVSGGPYTFYIETQGVFNDNSLTYSITCPGGGTTYLSGNLAGGLTFTSSPFSAVAPNSITLDSGTGTDNQSVAAFSAITSITYATTGATGATFMGLPSGVTGNWAGNVATISGTPTAQNTYNYTINLTGGCEGGSITGTITVTPALPIISSFTPTTGCEGATTVTIIGANLLGATAVSIGGTAVSSFTVNGNNEIVAVLGSGTTGAISVTTPNGIGNSSGTFTVNSLPTAPTTSDKCSFELSTNLVAIGTGAIEWYNNDTHTGSSLASGSDTAIYSANTTGDYYAFVTDGTCYSLPAMATATLRNSLPTAIPTAAGIYYATDLVTVGGFNHYCNCPLNLRILSLASSYNAGGAVLDIDGNPASDAYSIRTDVGATPLATLNNPPYNTLLGASGWKVINRTWGVELGDYSSQEPNSPVAVTSYFTMDEYIAVNSSLSAPLSSPEEMTLYKLKNLSTTGYANAMNALDYGHANIQMSNIYLFNNQSSYTPHWTLGALSPTVMSATYNVNEFSGGGGGGGNGGGLPFPVELVSFTGYNNGFVNVLQWVTASELNNKAFEIFHSADGVNFEKIGSVNSLAPNGTSNSNLAYQFTDNNFLPKSYYRLKQIDVNGQSDFSEIIEVSLDNSKPTIRFYPNPTKDELNVSMLNVKAGNCTLEVYNFYGQLLQTQTLTTTNGTAFSSLSLAEYVNGNYLVVVKNAAGMIEFSQKISKE